MFSVQSPFSMEILSQSLISIKQVHIHDYFDDSEMAVGEEQSER